MKTNFDKKISSLKEQISQKIGEILAKKEPVSLYEPMRYALAAGGKQIRPVLLLLANEAVGGKTEHALNAAAAVELVHNFTLVHDDIMDNDDLRRGRETVHKHWDKNVAILSGDGLLVLAYQTLNQTTTVNLQRVMTTFSNGILKVCEGQALDKEFENRDSVAIDEYFTMIEKKTAALISMSCKIGALLGTENRDYILAVEKYGHLLGRAFQVQDDLLDVIADERILGKNVGSDLQENKKTFLILHALQNANGANRRFLKEILSEKNISRQKVEQAIHLFAEMGTIDAAKSRVRHELEEAKEALSIISDSPAREYLSHFLKILLNRNY
ncbi:MAG: polyprenyl synthetase family protein [Actinobacteria bacterium]|nr:polyprenyl synthetase family protein [Actinomycetota bacterium]